MKTPIPPRSVVTIKRLWPNAKKQGHVVGEIRRIGYYSPQDGLDCIWLVDDAGEYSWTADHEWLFEHFDVVELSDEVDYFGADMPPLDRISERTIKTEQTSA